MTNKKFAEARRALRISQGRIARHAGVSQHLVSQFELGNWTLSAEKLAALEAALLTELSHISQESTRLAQKLGSQVMTA
jgi:transcriptional regulator with XRE-family HTH domain